MTTRRRFTWIAFVLMAAASGSWCTGPYISGAAFVIDVSGQDVAWRQWLPVHVRPVTTEDLAVPTRHGAITGRLYRPETAALRPTRTVIVVPGIHTAGVDEPRLTRFASRLAGEGMTVLSLPLPDLRQFRVTVRSTDMIEDAAQWVAGQPALAPLGRLSLFGISFGGGLSLVAAGRPSLSNTVDTVVSFGGHGDLPRVLRYLSTSELPDGSRQPAHDYGAAILLLAGLSHLVPPEQVPTLDHAVRVFLDASILDVSEPSRAASRFLEARTLGAALPEPAHSIMADVSARDVSRLGPRLFALSEELGGDPALSPERAPVTQARVFLIHGAVDTVIPQTETPALAAFLDRSPARQGQQVEWLISPTISHADAVPQIAASDAWALVKFWVEILR